MRPSSDDHGASDRPPDGTGHVVWIDARSGRLVFMAYLVLNLGIFAWTYHGLSPDVGSTGIPLALSSAGFVVIVLGVILWVSHRGRGPARLPTPVVMLAIFLLYFGGTIGLTTDWDAWTLTDQHLIIALSQGILLAIIYAAFSSPLYPERDLAAIPSSHRAEYLRLYLTTWWQWARLTTSVLIAFGITLLIAIVPLGATGIGDLLVSVALNLALGAFMLGVYAVHKKQRVHRRIRFELRRLAQ